MFVIYKTVVHKKICSYIYYVHPHQLYNIQMQSKGLCKFRTVTILKGVYFSFLLYSLIPLSLFIHAVDNSDETPTTLTEVFREFPQSLQANARTVPKQATAPSFHILSNLSLINHSTIRSEIVSFCIRESINMFTYIQLIHKLTNFYQLDTFT
jgi:hypothetical protein